MPEHITKTCQTPSKLHPAFNDANISPVCLLTTTYALHSISTLFTKKKSRVLRSQRVMVSWTKASATWMRRRMRDRSRDIVPIFTVSAFVWVADADFEICQGGDHATFSPDFSHFFFEVTSKCCANSPRICPIGHSQTPQICPDSGWDLYRDMPGA